MKVRMVILAVAAIVAIVVLSSARLVWVVPAWLIVVPVCLGIGYVLLRSKR